MQIDLSNNVVLVTGASRGIGRAIATQMGAAGATVAVHYNRKKAAADTLTQTIGNKARSFQADLIEPLACTRLFDTVVNTLGHIDVLVNNAGIAIKAPLDVSDTNWLNAWDDTLAVNLRATGLLCRAAILHFQERETGGRIINVSSRAAFRGDTAEYLAYAASKGGMVALTRSIARGYGKQGIKAFDVAPGFVRTEMAQEFIDTYGESYVRNDLALTRMTEPQDVAQVVVFLASGLADHSTGTSIDVNAGSYVH
jgi:3-oxoacyl-[acyl-carrier protein] reductase